MIESLQQQSQQLIATSQERGKSNSDFIASNGHLKGWLENMKVNSQQNLASYLDTSLKGLSNFGVTQDKAREILLELSDGRIDLNTTIKQYLPPEKSAA